MATHFNGNAKEITALNSFIRLIRAAESLKARLNNKIIKEGLTESQFSILEALYHLGPLCQKELGTKLLMSGGNITMVIDNLEKQKLVERHRAQNDRRFFKIHLTETGKNKVKNIFPLLLNSIVKEFDVLNEKEQLEIQRMCKLIGIKNQPK
jgi:MarR family 2-MHQ and catechol resistance regulon transcriptional repressor